MSLVNPNVEKMAGYVPGEQPESLDVIKLNTNENPYPPSPKVREAIAKITDEQLRRYPSRTRRSAPKAAIWRHASYFYCMTIRCFVRRPGNFESGNWEDNYRKLAYHGCPHAGGGCGIEILEYPFGAGNIGTARINRNRLPQRFGERLEYRLGHMVAVGTVGHIHMEIHPRGVG